MVFAAKRQRGKKEAAAADALGASTETAVAAVVVAGAWLLRRVRQPANGREPRRNWRSREGSSRTAQASVFGEFVHLLLASQAVAVGAAGAKLR